MPDNSTQFNPIVQKAITRLSEDDFIVFAGTGCSAETKIAPWKDILNALAKEANIDIPPSPTDEEYPDIAQKCYESIVKMGKEDLYMSIIRDKLTPKDSNWTSHQIIILDGTTKIITTNFDNTFENSFRYKNKGKVKKLNIQILPDLNPSQFFNSDAIIAYLHGKLTDHTTQSEIIFKTDEYNYFYPTAATKTNGRPQIDDKSICIESFLREIYKNHTMVFIGFSFTDKYFLDTLVYIYNQIRNEEEKYSKIFQKRESILSKIRHYAFLKKPKPITGITDGGKGTLSAMEKKFLTLKTTLNQIGIEVLEYDEHKDYQEWMECIGSEKDKRLYYSQDQSFIPMIET